MVLYESEQRSSWAGSSFEVRSLVMRHEDSSVSFEVKSVWSNELRSSEVETIGAEAMSEPPKYDEIHEEVAFDPMGDQRRSGRRLEGCRSEG